MNGLLDPAFLNRLARLTVVARRIRSLAPPGRRWSALRGPGADFLEYREYVPGEDAGAIDWKLSMRLDRLYVRDTETTAELAALMVVDGSPSMNFGRVNKIGFAARVAALIGALVLVGGETVEVFDLPTAPGKERRRFRGKTGLKPFLAALNEACDRAGAPVEARTPVVASRAGRTVARRSIEPRPGVTGEGALADLSRRVAGGQNLYLFTDMYDDALAVGVAALAAHHRLRAFALLIEDPLEHAPPALGPVRLVDAETGRRMDATLDAAAVAAYRRRYEVRAERLTRRLRAGGVGCVRLPTVTPFDASLVRRLLRAGLLA
ncbi:MAG: DUF58 domain-containing protein [Planctomycetes bacterium]|nr:DUF58 domain-containing protein [Planctomycetota bacterium]